MEEMLAYVQSEPVDVRINVGRAERWPYASSGLRRLVSQPAGG
jgi:hypothetical protein